MIYDYQLLMNQVKKELGDDIKQNINPLFEVLIKIHTRLVDANFQYATHLVLNNDLSRLVETEQYPILSQYNSHEQDYIKSAFCVCLNRQEAESHKTKKIKNN